MTAQIRSELRKMRTTPTNVGLALGLVGLVLFGVIAGSFSRNTDFALVGDQREIIGNGAFAAAFAAMVGVMAMTSEFRHGTIRATFVFTPDRIRVVLSKVVAGVVVGAGFGALGTTLALGVGVLMIRARGHEVLLDSSDVFRAAAGTVVMSALWAACGVGFGALVRNQAGAIVGLLAWVFAVETVLFQYVPEVARYAPGVAGTAMTGDTAAGESSVDLLPAVAGGLVLAAYAAVLVLAGALVTNRRDVT